MPCKGTADMLAAMPDFVLTQGWMGDLNLRMEKNIIVLRETHRDVRDRRAEEGLLKMDEDARTNIKSHFLLDLVRNLVSTARTI